jgi:uncharacterized membrane protein YkgB
LILSKIHPSPLLSALSETLLPLKTVDVTQILAYMEEKADERELCGDQHTQVVSYMVGTSIGSVIVIMLYMSTDHKYCLMTKFITWQSGLEVQIIIMVFHSTPYQ